MYDLYLAHHGILGMKWGVRRYQNEDGSLTPEGYKRYAKKNLRKSTIRNLEKWGIDEDHNVLYIIGNSGSGKSTTARGMAKEKDEVIHLDTFLEKVSPEDSYFNKSFDIFCRKNGVDIDTVRNGDYTMGERIKAIDDMAKQIEPYGKYCFKKGKRVIIEGAQMGDDTMFPDKSYFKDKPTITLKTNYFLNSIRAYKRDGNTRFDTIKTIMDPERKKWYDIINKNIQQINMNVNDIDSNRVTYGKHILDEYL